MLFRITIPDPVLVGQGLLSFRQYLADIILPLPFWRSRVGAPLALQLMLLIDSEADHFDVTADLIEKLSSQMELASAGLGQFNPGLARPAILNVLAVYNAKPVAEPEAPKAT